MCIIQKQPSGRVLLRKGVLKICSKYTGEHPCRSVISIKLQSSFVLKADELETERILQKCDTGPKWVKNSMKISQQNNYLVSIEIELI